MDNPNVVISIEETSRPEDVAVVNEGLRVYNLQHAPGDSHRLLQIFLRTPEQKVVGGLLGGTFWGWLHVDILWLDEAWRHQGYGTQLLAAAEQEALRRGCQRAYLDTMSFQALPFYERQGYTLWGTLDDFPPGHKRYFVQKVLV